MGWGDSGQRTPPMYHHRLISIPDVQNTVLIKKHRKRQFTCSLLKMPSSEHKSFEHPFFICLQKESDKEMKLSSA